MAQTIHLMVGNVGTGKSCTAEALKADDPDALYFNDDKFATLLHNGDYSPRIWTTVYKELYGDMIVALATFALCKGHSVIIDSTNMSIARRKKFIDISMKTGVPIIAYLHQQHGGLERRCKENRGQAPSLWIGVFNEFAAEYEAPTTEEGFSEIIQPAWKLW